MKTLMHTPGLSEQWRHLQSARHQRETRALSREGCIWLLPGGNRRPPFDYYHRCISLEETTVGFLSRAVASYVSGEAMPKSVAVAFSPRVGKKEEREIHWRYGLVSVRVERTMCGKKKTGEKREREKKKWFLLASFLRSLLGDPEHRSRKRLGLFAPPNLLSSKRSELSQFLMARKENSLKLSEIFAHRGKELLLLSQSAKVLLKACELLWRFCSHTKIIESMWQSSLISV